MLMATISSLDDQGLAECMREICKRMGVDEACELLAVDVALAKYHDGASRATSLNAGMSFALRVKRSGKPERSGHQPAPSADTESGDARFTRTEIIAMAAGALLLACSIAWGAL